MPLSKKKQRVRNTYFKLAKAQKEEESKNRILTPDEQKEKERKNAELAYIWRRDRLFREATHKFIEATQPHNKDRVFIELIQQPH